jgi:hypothetical protein
MQTAFCRLKMPKLKCQLADKKLLMQHKRKMALCQLKTIIFKIEIKLLKITRALLLPKIKKELCS